MIVFYVMTAKSRSYGLLLVLTLYKVPLETLTFILKTVFPLHSSFLQDIQNYLSSALEIKLQRIVGK